MSSNVAAKSDESISPTLRDAHPHPSSSSSSSASSSLSSAAAAGGKSRGAAGKHKGATQGANQPNTSSNIDGNDDEDELGTVHSLSVSGDPTAGSRSASAHTVAHRRGFKCSIKLSSQNYPHWYHTMVIGLRSIGLKWTIDSKASNTETQIHAQHVGRDERDHQQHCRHRPPHVL